MEINEQSTQTDDIEDINLDIEFPLPRKGIRLFNESPNINKNLVVDPLHITDLDGSRSPAGRWQLYANGYKRAADVLVDRLEHEFCCDELLYPILYLYGHFLELV